jgi:alpha-tubulin suppressor-like RCC1 family protein
MKRRRSAFLILTLGVTASLAATPAFAVSIPTVPVGAAWGANSNSTLGDGTATQRLTYTGIGSLQNVAQVSGGSDHSLALTTAGTVFAWGSNAHGALGTGTGLSAASPVQVPGLSGITQIAAGFGHSLALASNGTVWAWGDNIDGDLGAGTTIGRDVPVQVPGLTGITQISAGYAWSLALRSDGTVWAWGDNLYDELANASLPYSATPLQISGLSSVSAITAGEAFGMAIETTRTIGYRGTVLVHSVWTWGQDSEGEIGNGSIVDPEGGGGVASPVHVTGIPDAAGIAAGDHFGSVLGSDGSVWGWGLSDGVLGPAHIGISLAPVPVVSPGSTITQISGGDAHILALESSGAVLAWGLNDEGQLGDGSTQSSSSPVQVTGLTSVTQVDAAENYSLAFRRAVVAIGK